MSIRNWLLAGMLMGVSAFSGIAVAPIPAINNFPS
jgi:hypothetical protein